MRITFESDDGRGTSIIHVVRPKGIEDGMLNAFWHGSDRRFAIHEMDDIFCAETGSEILPTDEGLACDGCEIECAWLRRIDLE